MKLYGNLQQRLLGHSKKFFMTPLASEEGFMKQSSDVFHEVRTNTNISIFLFKSIKCRLVLCHNL